MKKYIIIFMTLINIHTIIILFLEWNHLLAILIRCMNGKIKEVK